MRKILTISVATYNLGTMIEDNLNSFTNLKNIDDVEVLAEIDGIVRGMLQEGIEVFKGMKSGDIDPRCEKDHCFTISDKARSIGGGVLEAIMYMNSKNLN